MAERSIERRDAELAELQDTDNWDTEHVERRPAVKGSRAVVSVALSRDEFQEIAAAAEQEGKKLSEYIRDSALARTRAGDVIVAPLTASGGGYGEVSIFMQRPPALSQVSGDIVQPSPFVSFMAAALSERTTS